MFTLTQNFEQSQQVCSLLGSIQFMHPGNCFHGGISLMLTRQIFSIRQVRLQQVEVVNVKDYGVPQSRRRLVMVGSLLGNIDVAKGSGEKVTVRERLFKILCQRKHLDVQYFI